MITFVEAASSLLALLPAGLFAYNLRLYAPLPRRESSRTRCSVLIPARNEEANIASALRSILQSENIDIEVVVLDDGSTDRTAEIVREFAAADARVRLEIAPPLPSGWCGKQHACHVLAQHALSPLLVFIDADVCVQPDALARMASFMEKSGAALASGIPRQRTVTFSERLLIPLIHFILLGYLPIRRMRSTKDTAYSAGCGQLFIARADAYHACGGHAAIRGTLHDGFKFPRAFRAAGFATDLFDATDVADCRMFSNNAAVWRGLSRNAHEALGSPQLIGLATLFLFGGQLVPFLLLALAPSPLTILGVAAALTPRLLGILRFRQSFTGALLHPFGISALLAIQWCALLRSLRGKPAQWKNRSYSPAHAT